MCSCIIVNRYRAVDDSNKGDSTTAAPPAGVGSSAIRLNLVDEHGSGNCYRIEADISLAELLEFYVTQTKGSSIETLSLRFEGRKLPLTDTPAQLSLPDLAVIGNAFLSITCLSSFVLC
jgi:hypothetical protein